MEARRVRTAVYRNAIPSFVEAELASLYGHIFSSLAQFRVYDGIGGDTHTYVSERDGRTAAVFLFRIERGIAQVLNEQIAVEAEEIECFVRHVFDGFPSAQIVSFRAVRTDPKPLRLPYQQFYRTEDIVLALPPTPDEYLDRLGKATRKNMKYHANRVKRLFPTLRFTVYVDQQVKEQHVRDIVELNRARMATKSKASEIDMEETERVIRLVKAGGLVSVMTIEDRVCAGTICSRVGANYFMHFNAHDPAYDDARLGKMCCYFTIRDCIERDGREFHFLWGRFAYKYLMLGVQQDFDQLMIYRSRLQFLLNAGVALPVAFSGHLRKLKFQLLDIANSPEGGSMAARLTYRSINYLRNLKQSTGRLLAARH